MHHKKGISLLETIIYIAILAVMVAVVVNTVLITTTAFGKSRVKRNVAVQGGAALERILREVRLANNVDVAGSVLGVHPGRLRLDTTVSSSDETPTTREVFLTSSTIMMLTSGSSDAALTADAEITNLVFYFIEAAETSEAVRVEMTITGSVGQTTTSQNFYGTAVLRRSY